VSTFPKIVRLIVLVLAAGFALGLFVRRRPVSSPPNSDADQWLRLNSQDTALDDLEEFADQLERMLGRTSSAKWAVVALHSSLQNFFVGSNMRGDPARVLKNGAVVRVWYATYIAEHEKAMQRFGDDHKALEQWIEDYGQQNPKPEEDLFGFLRLFKMTFGENHSALPWMEKLNTEFRNELIHMKPTGWSIRILLLLDIFEGCLPVLERLATNALPAVLGQEQEDRGRALVARVKSLLVQLHAKLGP